MENQVFKYVLKLNGEVAGYFVNVASASTYIEYIEDEVDVGNVDGSDIERWEIERWEDKLPSDEWFEFGLVDDQVLGAMPGEEGTYIDLGFILARCDDDADFQSEVVRVK